MRRFFWPAVWLVAIVSLSQTIHAGKALAQGVSALGMVAGLCWLTVLLVAMGLLSLRTYALERARGTLVHRIGLFERLLERGADGE